MENTIENRKTSITARIFESTDKCLRHWAVDQGITIGEAIDKIVTLFFQNTVNNKLHEASSEKEKEK